MSVFHSIILGVMQGIGEFLPVSSSAHLALAPYIFGWSDQGQAYDVMLHLGTLLAVVIYFARDWFGIFRDAVLRKPGTDGKMLWYLIAATVPAGVAGVLLEKTTENIFRNPLWIACALIVFSGFIYFADRTARQELGGDKINLKDAVIIGLAQCIALMPGASRSGMTMMAALFLGYSRPFSARFSFLLSTPIIFGAGVMKAMELSAGDIDAAFVFGLISSFVTGLAVISFFMSWIKKRTLLPFIIYRILLGLFIIFLVFK